MRILPILLSILLTPLALADPVGRGPGRLVLQGAEPITAYTYKPASYAGGPILVVVHGLDRNAKDYRDNAITLGDRFGMLVVAPEFDAARFPGERFQRGGLTRNKLPQPKEAWTYGVIQRLVAQVRAAEASPELPYYVIGHSAGGQFANRMAAFLPGEAVRIVATNPGSLVFPTRALPFGYGFGGLPPELSGDGALRAYLAAPLTLYLGTADLVEDANFDVSSNAMKEGGTRLDRGRACFEMARALAAERNWAFNWRKVEKAGVGHSSARMFAGVEAEEALFGRKAAPGPVPVAPAPSAGPVPAAPAPAAGADPVRLEAFTGNYRLAPGLVLAITREGGDLFVQATRQEKAKLTATGPASFLCEPAKATLVFESAGTGKAAALVLTQHGKEIRARRLDPAELERDRPPVIRLDAALLQAYAGRYALAGEVVLNLVQEGDHLLAKAEGYPTCELYPSNSLDFFSRTGDAQVHFETDAGGKPVRLVLQWDGRRLGGTRME